MWSYEHGSQLLRHKSAGLKQRTTATWFKATSRGYYCKLKKWRKHVRFRLMVQVNDGNASTGSDKRKEKFTLLYDAAITFFMENSHIRLRWWNTSQIWKIGQFYVKSRQRVPIHLPFRSASSDCVFLFIVLVGSEWTLLSTVYGQLKKAQSPNFP